MGLLFAFWFLSPCPQGYAASDFKVVLKAGGGSGEDITLIYRAKALAKQSGGIFTENGKEYIYIPPCFFLPPTEKVFMHWVSEKGEVYAPFTIIPATDLTLTAVWTEPPSGATTYCFEGTIHRNLFKAAFCSSPYTKQGFLHVRKRQLGDYGSHLSGTDRPPCQKAGEKSFKRESGIIASSSYVPSPCSAHRSQQGRNIVSCAMVQALGIRIFL